MSNLYKGQYVIKNDNERIINSNEIVAAKMDEYIQLKKRERAATNGEFAEGFVEGITAESVEVIEPEEPEETVDVSAQTEELLESARMQAADIIESAKVQAEHMREQALTEGKDMGYEQGKQLAMAEIESEKMRLQALEQSLRQEYDAKAAELEPQLVDVITEVVDKVFQIKFSDEKNILLYLIDNAMQNADGCKQFRVHVGGESYPYISTHKTELAEHVAADVQIDVIEDISLGTDQCMIETDAGVFDCSVGIQMQNLIKEIKTLSL